MPTVSYLQSLEKHKVQAPMKMMHLVPYIIVHLCMSIVMFMVFIVVRRIRGDDKKVKMLEKRIKKHETHINR